MTCMSYFKMKRIFGPYFVVRAWACGAMDNASDYGSEDSRFESWQARKPDFESNLLCATKATHK